MKEVKGPDFQKRKALWTFMEAVCAQCSLTEHLRNSSNGISKSPEPLVLCKY